MSMPAAAADGATPSPVTIKAARRLNRAAGVIAASVLLDSATEHYRGTFYDKAMWTPLVTASASLLASLHGMGDKAHGAHRGRDLVYVAAGVVGVVGTGFHLHNVLKRVGGISWQNLFYAAPLGAPAAMTLSGAMGLLAERVRDNPPGAPQTVLGLPAGRVVAAGTGLSLLGAAAEAGLLHFRGAFNHPAMWLPVTMPPVAAACMLGAALGAGPGARRLSRGWLAATAVMGVAGVAFHAVGVAQSVGGWRNWRQNLFAGPPIPAPPAFTGLALAGLAALALIDQTEQGPADA